tara:strand:+ start:233 stop:607 length:375 start_codon:yes stop_codon:yes gene_type:complete
MYNFTKEERLTNKKAINNLFLNGNHLFISPFNLFWLEKKDQLELSNKVLITVSKKNIKLASKRNFLKRRIKEAFRLNKIELYELLNKRRKKIDVGIVYQDSKIYKYEHIEEKIKLLLNRLIERL